jgi:lipid A 4'-phosphatase
LFFNISYKFILTTLLVTIIFSIFPKLDIYIASLFYKNNHFFLKDNTFIHTVYTIGPLIAIFTGVLTGLIIFYLLISKKRKLFNINLKAYIFVLLILIIGPGLIVNSIFKEFSGRARPRHIVEFGGQKEFTRIFKISNQCKTNCSFVSGHSAAGFFFCAVSLIFSGRKRKFVFWSGVALGSLLGFVRMAAGGHFFTDVYFSFAVVYLTGLILHYWMFKDEYKQV